MVDQHQLDPESKPYDPAGLIRKPDVGIDQFLALDLRVGTVREVADFDEARIPAFKLWVDFGPVVGILATSAKVTNYSADSLMGRQVIGAINLGTKRIAGFVSEFLLIGALDPSGIVHLALVDGEVGSGAPVA